MASNLFRASPTSALLTCRAQLLFSMTRSWFAACRVSRTLLATVGMLSRQRDILLFVVPRTVVMAVLAAMPLLAFLLSALSSSLEADVAWPMTIAIEAEVALPEIIMEAVFAVMLATILELSMAVTSPLRSPKARSRSVEVGDIPLATAPEEFGPSIIQPAPRETDRSEMASAPVVIIAMAVA